MNVGFAGKAWAQNAESSVSCAREWDQTRKEHPWPLAPRPKALWILIIEDLGDSWFWLLRGDFPFLQAIRWNGVRHQFLSKGLSFHSLPYRPTENLPVDFYPHFPPLAAASPLPCLREKEGNGSDRS